MTIEIDDVDPTTRHDCTHGVSHLEKYGKASPASSDMLGSVERYAASRAPETSRVLFKDN